MSASSYTKGWQAAFNKFAVSSAMYGRAIGNAAQRQNVRIAPQVAPNLQGSPTARPDTNMRGLGRYVQQAGASGAQARLPGQQALHDQVTSKYQYAHPDRLPHDFHDPTGTLDIETLRQREQGHAARQIGNFDAAVQGSGRASKTPGGTAALNQQLRDQFGSTDHDHFFDIINKAKQREMGNAKTTIGAGFAPPDAATNPGRKVARPPAAPAATLPFEHTQLSQPSYAQKLSNLSLKDLAWFREQLGEERGTKFLDMFHKQHQTGIKQDFSSLAPPTAQRASSMPPPQAGPMRSSPVSPMQPRMPATPPPMPHMATPLRKIGFDFSSLGHVAKKVAPYAAGIGIPLGTMGGIALSKPAIQSNLKNLMSQSGSIEDSDKAAPLPENAIGTADKVKQLLAERGIDPASLRMAVDAPPGTGKTTLSKAMAQQLGMQHYGLDWLPGNKRHSIMGGGHIETMPRGPKAGEILEHYNLLRAYDPEVFDAAIHIKKDPETIKQQIMKRGRSAGVSTFMDYNKANQIGDLSFDTLAGDPMDLGGGAFMKLRPHEGWGTSKLDDMLLEKGIDPSGLSRHEKLLSIAAGKKQTGAGWVPYAKNPLSRGESALALGSIPLGLGAAYAARKYLR